MCTDMRRAHQAIDAILKRKLFAADRTGCVVFWNGKWHKPSDCPEAFGLMRAVKKVPESAPVQQGLF